MQVATLMSRVDLYLALYLPTLRWLTFHDPVGYEHSTAMVIHYAVFVVASVGKSVDLTMKTVKRASARPMP